MLRWTGGPDLTMTILSFDPMTPKSDGTISFLSFVFLSQLSCPLGREHMPVFLGLTLSWLNSPSFCRLILRLAFQISSLTCRT